MAFRAGDIVSHLTLDTNKYFASMAAAGSEAQKFARDNATAAQKAAAAWNIFGTVGIAMTAGVTTPVVGGFAASTKAAIEFESAFAGVRKTVDASEREYAKLNKSLLEMSRVVPKDPGGLATIMELGGQLGVPQEKLEKFTRTIADLAVSTNLSEEAGASMLAQYANVMRMDISNIDRLGSVIVDLGNNTATTEADIVSMAQRLSGAGSILDLSNAQVMGLAATMASLGINAEAGGSAASRVLQRMQKDVRSGSEGLKVYAQTAGMSAEAFAAAFGADPLAALIAFIDGLNEVNEAGGNVYGILEELNLADIRITDTLLRLTGGQGQLQKNIALANKAWEDNIALTKEAEQRYGTTESRIQLAKNSIQGAGISIGNAFLPVIGQAADGVADLANQFADLDEEQQKSIITQAGVAASIGPAMMLIKGLAGVLSGPGGLIALTALGAAGIAYMATTAKEADFSNMEEAFGNIKLSADEIKEIIAVGFGSPAIDTAPLIAAREDADTALNKFVELQDQLEKDVYLVQVGVSSMTQEEVDARVGSVVSAAQSYLLLEENAALMTIKAYFGPDDEGKGAAMISGLDSFMAGARDEMAAKGKELGDALKGAIADGKIDAEEEKIIANLQNELAEIAARGALMKSEAERDLLIANAQRRGLSVESVREGNRELQNYGETLRADLEAERELMIRIASNLKTAGALTEAEYRERREDIEYRYGDLNADVDMSVMDTAWEMFGSQLQRGSKLKEVKDILNRDGFNYFAELPETEEDRRYVEQAKADAQNWLKEFQPLYEILQGMDAESQGNMPERFKEMLQFFHELDALANLDESNIDQLQELKERVISEAEEAGKQAGEAQGQARAEAESEAYNQAAGETTVRDYELTPETDPAYSVKNKGAEAVKEYVQGANEAAEEEEVHIWDTMDGASKEAIEAAGQAGHEAGSELVQNANEGAEEEEVHLVDILTGPVGALPDMMGAIGSNAADAIIAKINAAVPRARAAGTALTSAIDQGARKGLLIASPSKKMEEIGDIASWSLNERLEVGMPQNYETAKKGGEAVVDGYRDGYADRMANDREYRPLETAHPLDAFWAGATDLGGGLFGYPKGTDKAPPTPPRSGKAAPIDYSAGIEATLAKVAEQEKTIREMIAGYDSERERLLNMTGAWRPYYDKSQLDQQIANIQSKWQTIIDAETAGYEALSAKEKTARSEAHSKLMAQLQKNQQDEVAAVRENYQLQQRMAADFLSAQADALTAAYQAKQDEARADDYEKTVADLEKRIRQTRSARERRELSEELERVQRDEALRQEQAQLNLTLQGIRALQTAVSSGVIGLGDLLGDKSLPIGSGGLKAVQGITAEQLESVLQTITDRQAQTGGNTYTIDLSGAVIRDDGDIDRIVAEFERRMRSIQRSF